MNRARTRFLVVVSWMALLASGLIGAAPAAQAATINPITSAGPLTNIWVSDTLHCQVEHAGDTSYEWFDPGNPQGNCGTFLYLAGNTTAYGPTSQSFFTGMDQAWTPVSQSAVTGTGAANDPYTVVTVVDAGTTGVRVTQTDKYVVGEESYRTDIRIDNNSGNAINGILYRLGDCYLQGSDTGFGRYDSVSGAVGCSTTSDNSGRVEEWLPITTGSHYYEAGYSGVVGWPKANHGQQFPNTIDSVQEDNGTGISWPVSVLDGGHSTFSELSAYSPTGAVPLSTAKTADDANVAPDGQTGYTITVHNPNNADVTLDDVTDNLPTGFTYQTNSSTNATTNATIANPSIAAGNNLTWAGPFTAPAGGDFSLHFNVVVSSTPGNYNNQAGADTSENYSVAPTGPTAQVHVNSNGLSVTKTDSPDPVTAGDNVGYTIHVTNDGPDSATGVTLDDNVPSDATFVSFSSPGDNWTCSGPSEGFLSCDGPNLSVGESSDVTLVFRTSDPPPAGGTITDSATVSDNEGGTASDDETTTVVPRDPDEGTGYVPPEGGKVTTGTQTTADDPTNAAAKLPEGPGGVVTLNEDPANDPQYDGFCGTDDCRGNVVIITIPDGYDDPSPAPKLQITYDVTISSPRARIYVQKPGGQPVRVPRCIQLKVANPSPCVGRRVTLTNGDQRVNILLLSGDPIFGKH